MKKNLKRILALMLTVIMLMCVGCTTGSNKESKNRANGKTYNSASDEETADNSPMTGHEEVGTIINFGSYPQSEEKDGETISKLEGIEKNWISYGYYSGTGNWDDGKMIPSDYMKYADMDINGDGKNDYRAVTFNLYRPSFTGGTTSLDDSEQDDNGYFTNNIYYFKYEPLKWRVLDAKSGLVMSENIIDSQAYNNFVIFSNGERYGNVETSYFASDYANSSIRKWLNEDFYNTAFTKVQKSKIKLCNCENKSAYNSKYDSTNTNDKIFLLSYTEVLNSNYGFSSSDSDYDVARQLKGTDYAKCQGLWTPPSSDYESNSCWKLRSPDGSYDSAYVEDGGLVDSHDDVYGPVNGIVPALCLSTN